MNCDDTTQSLVAIILLLAFFIYFLLKDKRMS